MKKIIWSFSIILGFLSFVMSSCDRSSSDGSKSKHAEEKVLYQCPMDCESGKTYDKPGECPVCEMDLEQKVEI